MPLPGAQVTCRPLRAQPVGQLAEQIEHGPGNDHHQQLWQQRLAGTEKLRQEGGKEEDVLWIAAAKDERPAEQPTEARGEGRALDLAGSGCLARLLPALPSQIEQVQRANQLECTE